MNTLLDYDRNLPAYINITNGKTTDNKGAYDIPLIKKQRGGSKPFLQRFFTVERLGTATRDFSLSGTRRT